VAGVVGMPKKTKALEQATKAQSRAGVDSRRHGVVKTRRIKRIRIMIAIIAVPPFNSQVA